jgi:hypothetical protein
MGRFLMNDIDEVKAVLVKTTEGRHFHTIHWSSPAS